MLFFVSENHRKVAKKNGPGATAGPVEELRFRTRA
jgi:hypothetical protein